MYFMCRYIVTILFLFISTNLFSQNINWITDAKSTNGSFVNKIRLNSQNEVISAGYFTGEISFGDISLTSRGLEDTFLVKYLSNGTISWVLQFSSDIRCGDLGIDLDSEDNIYISGGFIKNLYVGNEVLEAADTWNTFIAKLTSEGTLLWIKSIEAVNVFSSIRNFGGLTSNKTDNFIILCDFFGIIKLPNGEIINNDLSILSGLILISINQEGNLHWYKILENARGEDIFFDNNNNEILFTGSFVGTVNFASTTINSVTQDYGDIFFAKINGNGNPIWLKSILKVGNNTSLNNSGKAISVSSDNEVYLAGDFKGIINVNGTELIGINTNEDPVRADIFIAKFTQTGDMIWAKRAGSSEHDVVEELTIDDEDNLYITGSYSGLATFGESSLENTTSNPQMFIAKFNNEGNIIQSNTIAIQGRSTGLTFCLDTDNNIVLSGVYLGKIGDEFDAEKLLINELTHTDVYLVKFCLSPNKSLNITATNDICIGSNNVLFEVELCEEATAYLWSFPDGVMSSEGFITQDNRIYVDFSDNSQSGNIVVTPIYPCGQGLSSLPFQIIIQNPITNISLERNCDAILLSGDNIVEIRWYRNGQVINNTAGNVSIPLLQSGEYTVEVENACGIESKSIFIEPSLIDNIIIPNAFTPNNDGVNDFFEILNFSSPIILQIYNRHGIKVYESLDYQNNWNGNDLPSGIYYYVLKTNCIEQKINGWVNLIRE